MTESNIVLITGANTGIGYHIVRALYSAEKPYTIIVASRDLSKGEAAITAVKAEFPSSLNELIPLQVDVEYDGSIKEAHDAIESKFGKLDTLVNNAGTVS
ncbi:hypothetical protein ARAM_007097 [Aspergillus rambellii]|uniref:Short-chain dehydrogenase n=1 Tax=Aspergillus rambellii TaxID=308745 RepID=A0A0F8XTV6_9EURO|nr:hypothetical protein ARAM_007097 [Aspergillus rambellii]